MSSQTSRFLDPERYCVYSIRLAYSVEALVMALAEEEILKVQPVDFPSSYGSYRVTDR